MPKKKLWYIVLFMLPVSGAWNSSQQFGEPWTGFLAGLLVAGVLLGIVEGIRFLVRKSRGGKAA